MKILILNAGSSSHKVCLYEILGTHLPSHPPQPLWDASVDWTHRQSFAEIEVKTVAGAQLKEAVPMQSRLQVLTHLLENLWQGKTQVIEGASDIDGVGHRVVHGGQAYRESIRVTVAVKTAIAELALLAPVHNPLNLEGIEAIEHILGENVPQIAVFDTAFHRTLPDAAAIYPVPYEWTDLGIRRYGFHGISHQYCAQRAAQILNRDLTDLRLLICHLGNGCSLCAIRNGDSVDTTMGFTPLEGLMMGSRSGSIDPGILIHLIGQVGYTNDQVDQALNQESGLLGVSGLSSDFRQVLAAAEAGHERAKLALEIYVHRLRSGMGAMLASLGGLDAVVFTAGVGENAAIVRTLACQAFEFLGLKLDPQKNQACSRDQDIAAEDSTTRVLVIQTRENWAIAQQCFDSLKSQAWSKVTEAA